MSKKSKASVHYRNKGTMDRHCSKCTMWRAGSCTAVAGRIFPEGVCDIFERRK